MLVELKPTKHLSAEEFWRDAPEDRKAELIDGAMSMPSPAVTTHERLLRFLYRLLNDYVEEHDLGEVLGSRTAVELAPDQVYEPDILFVAKQSAAIVLEKGIVGAPELVIEILSRSTAHLDRGPKLRGYERAGVREVWLVHTHGLAGTRFYQREGAVLKPVLPGADNRIYSAAIPGFWIDVRWLWPDDQFIRVREALAAISGAV